MNQHRHNHVSVIVTCEGISLGGGGGPPGMMPPTDIMPTGGGMSDGTLGCGGTIPIGFIDIAPAINSDHVTLVPYQQGSDKMYWQNLMVKVTC